VILRAEVSVAVGGKIVSQGADRQWKSGNKSATKWDGDEVEEANKLKSARQWSGKSTGQVSC
jgi:hypothetical protein